jgi:sugar lactone lactonase YvrE
VAGWTADGIATASALNTPQGLAIDAAGNVYVADSYNQRVRKIDATGMMTTVAGSGYTGFSGDGGSALAAAIDTPVCVAVFADGSIVFGDAKGDRIRTVDAGSGNIHTLAGGSAPGYGGDGGPAVAALLHWVTGLAVTAGGSLLLSDYSNLRIREITTPLGVKDMSEMAGQLICFPVPAGDVLTVRWNERMGGACNLRVLSAVGQEMMSGVVLSGQDYQVGLGGWPVGSYRVVVSGAGMAPVSIPFVKAR